MAHKSRLRKFRTFREMLSKRYHEQRNLFKNGSIHPAEEPDGMNDHLIRDLSPSSTPAEQEEAIRYFMNRMMSHNCPKCHTRTMGGGSSSVFKHAERIIAPKKDMSRIRIRASSAMTEDASHVTCPNPKCRVGSVCPCCSQVFPTNRSAPRAGLRGPSKIGWCCDGGRIFYIFALLCGPKAHPDDRLASFYQDQQVMGKNAVASASGEKHFGSGSSGTGYAIGEETHQTQESQEIQETQETQETQVDSGGRSDALSFSVPPGSWFSWNRWGRKKGVPLENKLTDSRGSLASVLEALTGAWPHRYQDSQFDQAPPQLLLAIARRSPLMIKLGELLADDMAEVQKQTPLYMRVMDFLEVLAAHPFSAPLVEDRRISYPLEKTILRLAFDDAKVEKPDPKSKGKAKATMPEPEAEPAAGDEHQSLVDLASKLAKQAHNTVRFYKRAQFQKPRDVNEIIAVCERICRFAQKDEAPPEDEPGGSGPSRAPSSARSDPSPAEDRKEEIKQWLAENNVAPIEVADWKKNYVYAGELEKSQGASVTMGRMHHIGRELAVLGASLPEGIYVRYDEARPDAMKVLIAGPEGTPYENGLWEFDLFCPVEYPRVPPVMTCKTVPSACSRRGFNPNLYPDGKVCLSLLNTWEGQPWIPYESTLMQLFVSIQSMVFCPEPYENEPDRHGLAGTPEAENYNAWVRYDTVAAAMAAWLVRNRSPGKGYVWGDVVGRHFELKAARIVSTVDAWKVKSGLPEDGLRTLAAHLKDFA